MKKKNHGLFFLTGVLLCCSLFLGIRGMTMAFDRSGEMTQVNKISWTLHPCDIGNRFANITYNGEFRVFLADGVVDYAGGSEDGRPITRTGETIESRAGDAKLEQLYLRSSRIGKDGHKRFGCLRYDGSIAIPFEYDGLMVFESKGKYDLADQEGEILIKAVFDDLQLAGDRYLIGVYRGRYGIGLTEDYHVDKDVEV